MTVKEVMEIAKQRDIKPEKGATKAVLIRTIQKNEGNFECFGTMVNSHCDQQACLWLKDCKQNSNGQTT